MPVTGIVLAGGQSTRFGSDKASAILGGRTLLAWVVEAFCAFADDVLVVAAKGQTLPHTGARIVRDEFHEKGPLAGLVTGLAAAANDVCVAVSCDAPLVRPELLEHLAVAVDSNAAAVAEVGGRWQPLPGAYRVDACLGLFRERVRGGRRSMMGALEAVNALVLDQAEVRRFDPELLSFRSANTPEELAVLAALLGPG